jgi:hypothetical protein
LASLVGGFLIASKDGDHIFNGNDKKLVVVF